MGALAAKLSRLVLYSMYYTHSLSRAKIGDKPV